MNLRRVRQFPWTLYHRPIEDDLVAFLARVAAARPEASVLVVGCGLMQELDRVPRGLSWTCADVDARALAAVRDRNDPRVRRFEQVAPDADLSRLGRFDAAYAKEVIEHIVPYPAYLAGLRRAIRPGGSVWISTPNYGEPWLPLVEKTALEVVARLSGFTRENLHPSRFSRASLADALTGAGFVGVRVRPVSVRLALVATAGRP